jgi:hypothetical protein
LRVSSDYLLGLDDEEAVSAPAKVAGKR